MMQVACIDINKYMLRLIGIDGPKKTRRQFFYQSIGLFFLLGLAKILDIYNEFKIVMQVLK